MRSQLFKLKSLIKVITICLLFFHYINYSFANENHDCEFLASIIEEKFDLPAGILVSISNVEAGRIIANNKKKGWPWTVNHSGEGLFFENKIDAISYVKENLKKGDTNLDVGCMQISLKWHSNNFQSVEDAFDPEKNILYAAKFLRKLYKDHGNWTKAIKFYHSSDPKKNRKYHKKVLLAWSKNNLQISQGSQKIVLANLILPVSKPDLKNAKITSQNIIKQKVADKNFVTKKIHKKNIKENHSMNNKKFPTFILNRWVLVEKFRKEFSNN